MSVRVCYVDESHNKERFVLTAVTVDGESWNECFQHVKKHRQHLKEKYGLRIWKEIHAHELVRGKGRSLYSRALGKWERSQVFLSLLGCIATLPTVRVFNVCLSGGSSRNLQMRAWDRLLNRIERNCDHEERNHRSDVSQIVGRLVDAGVSSDVIDAVRSKTSFFRQRAIVIPDEGRERDIEKAIRKMHTFNYIPSAFGQWENGQRSKNITTQRVIEDPIFKQSHRSYFVQLADCAAYALLKRESSPTPLVAKYGIDKMWDGTISKVCVTAASRNDPHGVVRN